MQENKKPFSDHIRDQGGRTEVSTLPEPVRSALEPFDHLMSKATCACDDVICFTWVRSPKLWAASGIADGVPTIAMAYGAALALEEAFSALYSLPELFTSGGNADDEEPWDSLAPASLGLATEFENTGCYWRVPFSETRRKASQLTSMLALLFVFNHELAHLRRSHAGLTGQHFMLDDSEVNSKRRFRLFEIDADWCGAVSYSDSELLQSEDSGEGPLVTAIFAVGMALCFVDRGGRFVPDFERSLYQHPLHRLFVAVDAVGVVLGRRYRLSSKVVQHCRYKCLLLLIQCAQALGRSESVWRNVRSDIWLTEVYAKQRSAYFQWESRMVKSGKLPLVGGCPSALDLADWDQSCAMDIVE